MSTTTATVFPFKFRVQTIGEPVYLSKEDIAYLDDNTKTLFPNLAAYSTEQHRNLSDNFKEYAASKLPNNKDTVLATILSQKNDKLKLMLLVSSLTPGSLLCDFFGVDREGLFQKKGLNKAGFAALAEELQNTLDQYPSSDEKTQFITWFNSDNRIGGLQIKNRYPVDAPHTRFRDRFLPLRKPEPTPFSGESLLQHINEGRYTRDELVQLVSEGKGDENSPKDKLYEHIANLALDALKPSATQDQRAEVLKLLMRALIVPGDPNEDPTPDGLSLAFHTGRQGKPPTIKTSKKLQALHQSLQALLAEDEFHQDGRYAGLGKNAMLMFVGSTVAAHKTYAHIGRLDFVVPVKASPSVTPRA